MPAVGGLEADELLPPAILRGWMDRIAAIADDGCAELFGAAIRRTLDRTLHRLDDGTVFVITGDIPAMWLRDAATQMRPYVRLLAHHGEQLRPLADMLAGVIARQFEYICHDPYANAFNVAANGNCHEPLDLSNDPWLWERKYEIDSLCFPFQLAEQLWDATGRTDQFDQRFTAAAAAAIETLETETDHEGRSAYRFVRPGFSLDTLSRNGLGTPVAVTGMTWAAFRPSDDACSYGYHIPGNLMAAHTLAALSRRLDIGVGRDAAALANQIRSAVMEFGVVTHPEHGQILAYEVDGLGNALLADDANMPSLLSLPLVAGTRPDDPLYQRTRAFVLSSDNPYFYSGELAAGPGSPHTEPGYVWPIALAVQGLTTTDPADSLRLLQLIAATTGGTGYVHESFDVDDDTKYSRDWFSWADSMYCELALQVCGSAKAL